MRRPSIKCWLGKGNLVHAHTTRARFEQYIMPHLTAAYNLARWLTRHDQDAEDVVQEAFLRAYKFFGTFHGQYFGHFLSERGEQTRP